MNQLLLFMKKNYKIILLVGLLSLSFVAFRAFEKEENDPEKDKILLELLTYVLERGHYSPKQIDDAYSEKVYEDYLEAMDPFKRFFLQEDVQKMDAYKFQLDDMFFNKDLTFFQMSYDIYLKRMEEGQKFYREVLAKPFDFKVDETFSNDYENMPYAKNNKELKQRWENQIKYSVLSNVVDKEKEEKTKKEKDASYEAKSFASIEKEARESALKTLDEYFNFIKEMNRNDWFGMYLNALSSQFDPHTNYMAPEDKDRFDTSISGKFEGIGARLQKKNEYTEISELISGGPAWRSKQLEAGDIILKVAQGAEEPVDVVGMRLDNIVKKIKGKKGTEVRLTVKKVDGNIQVISIIRDEVETEETFAKSGVIDRNGMKYGVIYLPKFYIDFENKENRDAAKDVAIEVEKLKKENIQGLIFDVRDNGGGSLKTVVDITGLFIDQGPVVQIQHAGGRKEVLKDSDSRIQWDGPLVVLVNGFSASASEILAAAIQDYKRGIVLGSKQTYGKGTVQNVIDLNQFVRKSSLGDLGAIKLTSQKFYRINGGSTQLEGVKSDVVLPDRFSYIDIGERDMKNAMEWTKIDAAPFKVWDKIPNYDFVIKQSKARVDNNSYFQLIQEQAQWIKSRRDQTTFSLHMDAYKNDLAQNEEMNKKFKQLSEYKSNYSFLPVSADKPQMDQDEIFKEKRNRWLEDLAKDIYIEEAIYVLDDLQTKPNKGLVKQGTIKSK
ncbi:MAG: carboxy terminal-processing peptidase [Flavobacteriales bacterium]|nr:carboxy terminal-processing peptidase [Flavobacteriales bacterium]